MEQNQWEIVILKPTSVFLTFLKSQLPDNFEVPDLELLQTDTTAYTIKKHQDEEATLNELEKNFPTMFRHEIQRWLGKKVKYEIEASFLDFLCCFKFEMHSHIVLMEDDINNARSLIRVRPRTVLLKWMKSTVEKYEELSNVLERINISNVAENATLVIKNFKSLDDIVPFIKSYFKAIFKAEMLRMCDEPHQWPEVNSFDDFIQYFAIDIHTQIIHLHQEV